MSWDDEEERLRQKEEEDRIRNEMIDKSLAFHEAQRKAWLNETNQRTRD